MILRFTCLIIFIGSCLFSFGQDTSPNQIRSIVVSLFEKMNDSDTIGISQLFTSDATLTSHYRKKGELEVQSKGGVINNWFQQIASSKRGDLEERIGDIDIKIDDYFAQAWVPYEFYYQGEYHHCGTNMFSFKQVGKAWKIYKIEDTRKKNCSPLPYSEEHYLDSLVNVWHHAASTANEETFFGMMKPSGIYIGTDASELWTAEEMEEWAAQYFQRDTAWHFTATERNWYFSENRDLAWFDELLDTWMGVCRSSGVLERKQGIWQLKHYHLSVTVPNEKIKEFIELCKE